MLFEKGQKWAVPKAMPVELSYIFITVMRGESPFFDNCQQTQKDNEKNQYIMLKRPFMFCNWGNILNKQTNTLIQDIHPPRKKKKSIIHCNVLCLVTVNVKI